MAQAGSGSSAGLDSEVASRAHLLRDAGEDRAAHVSSFYQPEDAPALQLRALPGKPASRQIRFHGHARALRAAPPQTRKARPRFVARCRMTNLQTRSRYRNAAQTATLAAPPYPEVDPRRLR